MAGFYAAKWTTRIEADCIVTANVNDFPESVLSGYCIEILDPDRFIANQWDLDPVAAVAAFRRMRARRKKPQSTPLDFANAMENAGPPTTAERLRTAVELL